MLPGRQRERSVAILALAGPIVVAMLAQTLLNIVDTIFVGRLDPAVAIPGQAGLGLALLILWTIGGAFAAVGIGTQVLTARYHGSGDDESAGATLLNGLVIAIVAALAATVAGWPFLPAVFELLTAQESVRELGIPYTRIRLLGIGAFVVIMTYKGFFDGIGSPGVHLRACLLMNGINIVLNYLLIFGPGPLPAFSVAGAAAASLIATVAGMVVMVGWSLRPAIRSRFMPYRLKKFSLHLSWRVVALSAPAAVAVLFGMGGLLVMFKVVDLTDQAALASAVEASLQHQAAALGLPGWLLSDPAWAARVFVDDWARTLAISRPPLYMTGAKLILDLLAICVVIAIAFGQSTATLVSHALGSRRPELAEAYGWDSVKLGMAFFSVISLLMILYPGAFLRVLTTEAEVITITAPSLRLMASQLLFLVMAVILCQAHFGTGRSGFVMTVAAIHGLALAPLAFLFAIIFGWGFMGIWAAVSLVITTMAVVLAVNFRTCLKTPDQA